MKNIEYHIKGKTKTGNEYVPSYGLLSINHAYNEGKLTFQEWLKLSREWAEQIIRQNTKPDTLE